MYYYSMLLFFLYGIIFGSFLNVLIYRLPLGIPIYKGRSFCTTCKHSLGAKDLVPVFSYLFLKGKCAYCGDKISIRYPIVELLTGVLFLLVYLVYGLSWYSVVCCVLMCILVTTSWIDYDTKIVFDKFPIMIAILGVISYFLHPEITIVSRLLGAVVIGGAMLLITIVSHGGIGGGDIKLMGAMGLFLGLRLNVFATLLAYVIAAIVILPLLKKNVGKKTEIPMVPFFAIASVIALLVGNNILNWYFSLF